MTAEPITPDETIVRVLVEKGLAPHTKPVVMSQNVETWWERPTVKVDYWPFAVVLIAFLIFVLLMAKGVPWA